MLVQEKAYVRYIGFLILVVGTAAAIFLGHLSGSTPLVAGIVPIFIILALCVFFQFENTVLALLIFRSAIDIFSEQQLPAVFAVSVDMLTISYVGITLLCGREVKVDKFFWLLCGWIAFQSIWVILLPLGGLGLGGEHLFESLKEWVRQFSWVMAYLLVLQMRDRMSPNRFINILFLSLVLPMIAGILQLALPASALPEFLVTRGHAFTAVANASRINGTLGHPNTFVTFLLLFVSLTYWKVENNRDKKPWLILLGILVFFIVSTKALIGLVMLAAMIGFLIVSRITLVKLIAGILFVVCVFGLFASTEFGRERLGLFLEIPFFNPDLDISRAIAMRKLTLNSFYWRLEQWNYLLDAWRSQVWLGYGFKSAPLLSPLEAAPHNDYIRILVESGIVGYFSFIYLILIQFTKLFRVVRSQLSVPSQRGFCFSLAGLLVAILVGMLTENIWSHTTLFFYWFVLLAVASWNWEEETAAPSSSLSSAGLSP